MCQVLFQELHFILNIFNSYNNPISFVLLINLAFRWGNRGTERLSILLKATEPGSGGAEIPNQTGFHVSRSPQGQAARKSWGSGRVGSNQAFGAPTTSHVLVMGAWQRTILKELIGLQALPQRYILLMAQKWLFKIRVVNF